MFAVVQKLLDIRSVPPSILMLTAAASYGGLILAAAVGWPLWAMVAAATLPWLLVFGLEVQWTYRHFQWVALMYLLVLTQGGHFVEHLTQMIQIHVFDKAGEEARGIFGQLDIEWVHFGFNTWILLVVGILLLRYRNNVWLWATLAIATWHQVEHVYIMAQYLGEFGKPGHPGLLSEGGAIAGGLSVSRPDLHFFYNVVETIPMLLAFGTMLRTSYDEWLARAFPGADAALLTETTKRVETLTFDPETSIVEQGEAADAFYIVSRGEVGVWVRANEDGPEVELATLGPGQYFGEVGLLTGEPRTASVRARDRVEVLRLDRETFRHVMGNSEAAASDLARVVSERTSARPKKPTPA